MLLETLYSVGEFLYFVSGLSDFCLPDKIGLGEVGVGGFSMNSFDLGFG